MNTEVAASRTVPTADAVGPQARCARLPRLRSSGLASPGLTITHMTASLAGQNETGGGPLPMINAAQIALSQTPR